MREGGGGVMCVGRGSECGEGDVHVHVPGGKGSRNYAKLR